MNVNCGCSFAVGNWLLTPAHIEQVSIFDFGRSRRSLAEILDVDSVLDSTSRPAERSNGPIAEQILPTLIIPDGSKAQVDGTSVADDEVEAVAAAVGCLGIDPSVPCFMQFAIPVLLLLNAGLFLSSNTSVGASIAVVIQLGAQRIELKKMDGAALFDFSLSSSVRDMWEAEVYPLALLIAIFSGVWPYHLR